MPKPWACALCHLAPPDVARSRKKRDLCEPGLAARRDYHSACYLPCGARGNGGAQMLLGRNAIEQALAAGHIVCDPAPAVIEGTHIDLHLGAHYWQARRLESGEYIDIATAEPQALYDYGKADEYLYLRSGGFVLAHTQERAGSTVPWLCPFIETRSTMARWGLQVHLSAGWGDAGYISHWTLELFNASPNGLRIPIGARICSIAFLWVEGNDVLYTERYNPADWTPEAMLPRRGNV